MFCSECGTKIENDMQFCPNCGAKASISINLCKKCGTQLGKNAVFCPNCGAAVGTEKIIKPKKRISIKSYCLSVLKSINPTILKRICIVLVLCISLFAIVKIVTTVLLIPTKEELYILANNSANGRCAAAYNSWIYYCDEGLWREKISSGKSSKLLSNPEEIQPSQVFLVRDKMIRYKYPSFFQSEPSGKKLVDFEMGTSGELTFQTDGKHFYMSDVFSFETNGIYFGKNKAPNNAKLICDAHPTNIYLYKNMIVFQSSFDTINDEANEYKGTWCMNTDGSNVIKLLDYCPDYIIAWDDVIYYENDDSILCSMDMHGNKVKEYGNIEIGDGLNTDGKYIYFVSENDDCLHRINMDGSYNTIIYDKECSNIIVADDWIVVKDNDDFHLVIMKKDGHNSRVLVDN